MKTFTNMYSINKTLRFELKPYGKTDEKIREDGILSRDKNKADIRKDMQKIIDEKYKSIIEERLSKLSLDADDLEMATSQDNSREEKEEAIERLKRKIQYAFKDVLFQEGKFIKELLNEQPDNETIRTFERFTTYFTNFFKIREHVFTGDTSGSVAYRLINENLNIFFGNMERIEKYPEDLRNSLSDLNAISETESYNEYLTQQGITDYNEMLGGVAVRGDKKLQGINEHVNLYCQKNKVKLPRLVPLRKMILSDRTTASFVLDVVEDDASLIEMIQSMLTETNFSSEIVLANLQRIYIKFSELGNLPQVPYYIMRESIEETYDEMHATKKKTKKYEEERKKYIESDKYSLAKIDKLVSTKTDIKVIDTIQNRYQTLAGDLEQYRKDFSKTDWESIDNIKQSESKKHIKNLLDSLKALQKFLNMFDPVEEMHDRDIEFYAWLDENSRQVGTAFNEVYNKTRNYLTKKEYSTEKFKLNFDSPTLANGWDVNKEKDNSAFIMRKYNHEREGYDYFLGIWKKEIIAKEKITPYDKNGAFEKMQYKLYPDPSKMLPKQFVTATKWNEKYPLSEEFKRKYEEGYHKKGEKFDKRFLHELIDRYKHGFKHHEEQYQEVFGFELKKTEEYNEYSEFIQDVARDSYNIKFEKIADISGLIDEGKLYVFQIYSKDFSTFSKGAKNLHTIYFESLFSDENIKEKIFQLCGEAELFYRPASLKYDEEIQKTGHHYETLKDKFAYPIIKDRRYSQNKYFLHVPILINKNASNNKPRELNRMINDKIDQFTHVIGVDRGERHLIYLAVVEIESGKIVEQRHLDEIVNVDTKNKEHRTSYLDKLEEKAAIRDNERKSWEAIETIKELKEGYISQVVNEIRNLQEKYNAFIVFEDLNLGFKNARKKVEKQIYQKFELALIRKFNYLIDKKNPNTYLHGRQLTNEIMTLDKIGNQSGVVFYIPAWNTSMIDPVTGFVNLFYADELRYKNANDAKAFIEKIDRIYYENGEFKFDINYDKWNERQKGSRRNWTLTSYGTRIYSFRNVQKNNQWDYQEIDLTKEFEKILNVDGTLKSESVDALKKFMQLFKLMVNIRNSNPNEKADYILSPVADVHGKHFDSRDGIEGLPKDADANGAYNIARKGIMAVNNIKEGKQNAFRISHEEYLRFVQKK